MTQQLPNPGAETNTAGWSASNATLSRATTPVRTGSGAFQVAATAAGTVNLVAADVTTGLIPGGLVDIAGWARAATVSRVINLRVDWYNGAAFVSTTTVQGAVTTNSTTTGWTQQAGTVTMPSTATKGSLYGQVSGAAISEVHYWDDFLFDPAVPAGNVAPTANANADQAVTVGASVTLSGSGVDPDGTITAYTWTLTTRPVGSVAVLAGTGASRTFTADLAGLYVGSLTVTDNGSPALTSAADTVNVTATAAVTELLTNTGAEVDTSGTTATNATLSRTVTSVRQGAGAFLVTATAAGTVNHIHTEILTGFVAGGTLNIAGYTLGGVAGRNINLLVDWYNANTYLSSSGIGGKVSSTTAYVELLGSVTVPAAATKFSFYGQVQGCLTGEVHRWDTYSVVSGSAAVGSPQPADSTTRIAGVETATRARAWIGGIQTP